jgi:hypothetical protein
MTQAGDLDITGSDYRVQVGDFCETCVELRTQIVHRCGALLEVCSASDEVGLQLSDPIRLRFELQAHAVEIGLTCLEVRGTSIELKIEPSNLGDPGSVLLLQSVELEISGVDVGQQAPNCGLMVVEQRPQTVDFCGTSVDACGAAVELGLHPGDLSLTCDELLLQRIGGGAQAGLLGLVLTELGTQALDVSVARLQLRYPNVELGAHSRDVGLARGQSGVHAVELGPEAGKLGLVSGEFPVQ